MAEKDREAIRYIRTVNITGTAASFTLRNPVLLKGQFGYESDTRKLKVGNGTTAWNSLAYAIAVGGGGVADHGALSGLGDDDHSQYHNDARGDARYPVLSGSYADPAWIASLAWTKLSGVPASFPPNTHSHVLADVTDAGTAAAEDVATTSTADAVVKALGTGKIDTSFLPDSILGQVEYQNTWNAASNIPAIPAASSANKGHYYIASSSVASSHGYSNVPAVDFATGDWIISDGSAWSKVDNTDAVASVFGRTGPIVAASGDYSAGQVTNTPAGNIAATTVQAALNELDSEKQSISSLAADVRNVVITGLSLATNQVIAATDTVLQAFGYLQAQITDRFTKAQSDTRYMGVGVSTAAQGPGFATDTLITGSAIAIPSGGLKAGTAYRLRCFMSKTAAGTATPIFQVRLGTTGTTSDTSRTTLTFGAGTAVIDNGFFDLMVTFRSVGSGTSAVIISSATIAHVLNTTGFTNGGTNAIAGAVSSGFNSTADTYISVSLNAGTSAAWTVGQVHAQLFNQN